jgi:small subunit ribosomal protein S18
MPAPRRGGGSSGGKVTRYRKMRRKVCSFCVDKIDYVDYKNVSRIRRFVSERGKILPRRTTGTRASHQRILTHAIKRAREIALLPFTAE